MMYERIEPLTPIRAPTDVRRELSSMNPMKCCQYLYHFENEGEPRPSATSANPEYAFNTVITTAGHNRFNFFLD